MFRGKECNGEVGLFYKYYYYFFFLCWKDTCSNLTTDFCSIQGKCECGQCKCFEPKNGEKYIGQRCQNCVGCDTKCVEYEDCIRCLEIDGFNVTRTSKCNATCPEVEIVEQLVVNIELSDDVECHGFDEEDCRFNYVYTYENGKTVIKLQRQRACPPHVYVLGIVLGVIMAVVAVGMAFLFTWKLFTTIKDRKEFARFEKERMMAKWDAVSLILTIKSLF